MANLKIIIPMAGAGRRMGPLTQHRPKTLVRLADKRLLDHVLGTFDELERAYTLEYVFIMGHMGDQIVEHMKIAHPAKRVTYFTQEKLLGQSHAIYLARDAVCGPVLLTYCDTVNRMDFSFLSSDRIDGVASVQQVADPRRHGIAVLGKDGLVSKLVEKPETVEHKAALTGIYYFAEGKELIKAIETQMQRDISLNNEYYLADAINILLEAGMRIRAENALQWLDAGTPAALLDANAHLLRRLDEAPRRTRAGSSSILVHPAYIHESSRIADSIIGPNVSIGAHCSVIGSIIKNSIIDDGSSITNVLLTNSLIGAGCTIHAASGQSILADHDAVRVVSTAEELNSTADAGDS